MKTVAAVTPAEGETLLSNFDEGETLVVNAGGTIVTDHASAGHHAVKSPATRRTITPC